MKTNKANPLSSTVLSSLSGIIIYSLDAQFCYTGFSDSHRTMMKTIWGVDIALGQSILDHIRHEEIRERCLNHFNKTLHGEIVTVEEEYKNESRQTHSWWEKRHYPVYDHIDNIIGLTVIAMEITARKQIEQSLYDNEMHYQSVMDQAADGIFIADETGRFLDANRAGCELLGYSIDELRKMTIRDVAIATDSNPFMFDGSSRNREWLVERDIKHKDGGFIPVEINARHMENGKLVGIVRDVSMRKKEQERIRYLALVLDKISSAVISTDNHLRITQWNHGAEILYGWNEPEVIGRQIDEVCGTEFLTGQQEIAQQIIHAQKNWHGQLKQRHRSGREIWVDASVTLLENESGEFVGGITINHDVTERKLAEDQLRQSKESIEQVNMTLSRAFEREQIASRTDVLTGVFNRRYFFELLGYEFIASKRYERPLSLVMFDVDFLKKVNDTYGHMVGDELLKKAAQVVRGELREADILARYGGDEFVILLSNSDEQEAYKVLDRIYRETKSTFIVVEGEKLKISISAGIASLQPDMEKADQLVKLADQALYTAKNSGRNRMVVFTKDEGGK